MLYILILVKPLTSFLRTDDSVGNWICFYYYQEHHVLRDYIYSLLLKNEREWKVLASNLSNRECLF